MKKAANLARAKNLFRAFSKTELPLIKWLIKSTPKGSPERFRVISALKRAVKPETWSEEGPHRLTRLVSGDLKRGNPQIFRGGHNPTEPIHLTGEKVSLPSLGSLDSSRSWATGMEHHRHFTPWPDIARSYTEPSMGMHKVTGGRFGHVAAYDAKSFPAISANKPYDNFTEQYRGMSNAQYRDFPEHMRGLSRDFRTRDIKNMLDHPYSERFRDRIGDIRDDVRDLWGESHSTRLRMRLMLKERLNKLRESGPMDQLTDRRIKDYVTNTLTGNELRRSVLNREKDDYYRLYEMVLGLKGQRPSKLFMIPQDAFGTYYDATGLMRLYQNAYASGNQRKADVIARLFKRIFGYAVE